MLERLETERRQSGRIASAAQEEERRRIARELHDEVGQVLTGVMLQLDDLGLLSALRALSTAVAAQEGLRVERRLDLGELRLDPEVELAIYRVDREARGRGLLERRDRRDARDQQKIVEHHRSHVLEKLGMRDRVELTRYPIRRGLVEP